jgi:hypothetical protein
VYWILAAVLLLITLTSPRLRPAGLVGLAILGALLAWAMLQRTRAPETQAPASVQRGQPRSPARAPTTVDLGQVRLEEPQLSGGGAPFEVRGRIANDASDVQIRSVTIHIVRRDCYEGALDPSGCVVLWQDRHWMPLTVPPQETREFANAIWVRGSAPRARGEVRDSFELLAVGGERVAAGEADH